MAATPQNIAIILDGNRRFAKRLMQEPWKGHDYGRDKVEKVVDWCVELGIKELTLYSFSIQNFNRPKNEFEYLMNLMREAFNKFYDDPKIEKYGIKVIILGRYKMFPPDLVKALERIMEKTKENKGFVLKFALAYGGREEMIDAINKIVAEHPAGEISQEMVAKHLYSDSEPDLIIRTGGEKRTSNFLPWQSIYSEWFFLDKNWPEFEKSDLMKILEEYSHRERRFGK
jgi:tritrans,polycis-undecaprenyl-diphosphate synthase [geranylgeranyl-diphosphate specific]